MYICIKLIGQIHKSVAHVSHVRYHICDVKQSRCQRLVGHLRRPKLSLFERGSFHLVNSRCHRLGESLVHRKSICSSAAWGWFQPKWPRTICTRTRAYVRTGKGCTSRAANRKIVPRFLTQIAITQLGATTRNLNQGRFKRFPIWLGNTITPVLDLHMLLYGVNILLFVTLDPR